MIICSDCGRAMSTIQVGVTVVEYQDLGMTVPYKLWQADRYRCPHCLYEVISGFGENPTNRQGDFHFAELAKEAVEHGALEVY